MLATNSTIPTRQASAGIASRLKAFVKRVMPDAAWQRLRRWRADYDARAALERVRFGSLRRTEPVSRKFGFDRGGPIDRWYIERFLSEHADDVRGRVLEVGDATYTRRFGGDRVTHSDVLHAEPGNPHATVVGDLQTGDGLLDRPPLHLGEGWGEGSAEVGATAVVGDSAARNPHPSAAPTTSPRGRGGTYDCIILTQVLPFVYDVRGAVATCHKLLKPGGVVLATLPGVSQISRFDMDRWGDYWRFTSLSANRLFEDVFGDHVEVTSCGNVLAATAFLHGLGRHDLTSAELEANDPDYEVSIQVRAVRRTDDERGGGDG